MPALPLLKEVPQWIAGGTFTLFVPDDDSAVGQLIQSCSASEKLRTLLTALK